MGYGLNRNPLFQMVGAREFTWCLFENYPTRTITIKKPKTPKRAFGFWSFDLVAIRSKLTLIQKFYLQLWACATSYCLGQSLFLNLSMSFIIFSLSVSLPHNRHFLNIVCSPTHRNERKIFTKLQHW